MTRYEGVEVFLTEGDIITSKKGFLITSQMTKKSYYMFKGEYLGNGGWRMIKREECEAEKVD